MDHLEADDAENFEADYALGENECISIDKMLQNLKAKYRKDEEADGADSDLNERTSIFSEVMRYKKENGGYYHNRLLNMLDTASSYGQAHFTRVLGRSPQEYSVLNKKVRLQLKDRSLRLYSDLTRFMVANQASRYSA